MDNREPEKSAIDGFIVVDRRGRQRFLLTATKPPVSHGGRELPASECATPHSVSHLVGNDENGEERGGLLASANRPFSADLPVPTLRLGIIRVRDTIAWLD